VKPQDAWIEIKQFTLTFSGEWRNGEVVVPATSSSGSSLIINSFDAFRFVGSYGDTMKQLWHIQHWFQILKMMEK
jgi:hypothetical protein